MRKYILCAIVAAFAVCLTFYMYRIHNGSNTKELVFYGNIDTRTVNLGFRFLGKIETINKDEGDSVQKDEILATLDSQSLRHKLSEVKARLDFETIKLNKLKAGFREEEIEEAVGTFLEAESNLKLLEDIYQRQEHLFLKNATSQEAYLGAKYKLEAAKASVRKAKASYDIRKNGYQKEDIKIQDAAVLALKASLDAAMQDLEDSVIKSPSNGVVLSKLKEEGAIVNPGERVFEISKQDEFWVKAYIDEPYLGAISQGDSVLIYTDVNVLPYNGTIGYISPNAEFTPKNIETMELRSSLVYHFRVLIKNPDKKIKQGMPVTVKPKK